MTPNKNKTLRIVTTALDIYITRPLSAFGDWLIDLGKHIASPILNPVIKEIEMADQWQTIAERQRLRDERARAITEQMKIEYREAEERRMKSKAGKAGAIARWNNQAA